MTVNERLYACDVFKSVACATSLGILDLVAKGHGSNSSLAELAEISTSGVSGVLAKLARVGLIKKNKNNYSTTRLGRSILLTSERINGS